MVLGPNEYGAPGEIRTPGLLVRSQALYPTELRAQGARILPQRLTITIPKTRMEIGQPSHEISNLHEMRNRAIRQSRLSRATVELA